MGAIWFHRFVCAIVAQAHTSSMARLELWHLESPANTNSQALKQAEIEGEAKKWKNAKFLLHLAIYIDVLTPLKKLSLGFQKEKHDPVSKNLTGPCQSCNCQLTPH